MVVLVNTDLFKKGWNLIEKRKKNGKEKKRQKYVIIKN